jgi:sulfate adenylyltransferase subunit 2
MTDLERLEHHSVHLLREAHASLRRLCMLWSIGKDSTVMVWLARKAFFGRVPFPLVHIDTSFKIPEMIAYRDRLAAEWDLQLIYGQHAGAIAERRTFPDGAVDRLTCCASLKTDALKKTLSGEWPRYRFDREAGRYVLDPDPTPFTGVIVGVRADEEGSRAKERYFSPRDRESGWAIGEQPPELWQQYNTEVAPDTHVRVHPLLDWTEAHVWEYIERERIPVIDLYFDRGEGTRYRSLGCAPCTQAIASTAADVAAVRVELTSGALARVAERAGRAQDAEDDGGLESLRRDGYM